MEWMRIVKRYFRKINLQKAVTYNFWLKLISLFIAIVIWYYVSGEITQGVYI